MLTALASNFVVRPKREETAQELYDQLKDKVRRQAETYIFGCDGNAVVDWETRTPWRSVDGTMALQWGEWRHSSQGTVALADIKFNYRAEQRPWEVEIKVGTTGDEIIVSAKWRRAVIASNNAPLSNPPQLLRRLAEDACCAEASRIPYSLHQLAATDVYAFYTDVLGNPDRRTPVILVSLTTNGATGLIDAEKLAKHMVGLAHVYQFIDDAAAQAFRGIAGRFPCFDGSVRLYRPRFDPTDEYNDHPRKVAKQLRDMGQREGYHWLFQLVAQGSHRYFDAPSALRYLELQRREDESTRLQRREMDAQDLQQWWENALAEQDALKAKYDRLEQDFQKETERLQAKEQDYVEEIDRLKAKLSHHEDRISQLESGIEVTSLREDEQEPKLCLSRQAWEIYREADPNLRLEFAQELEKLRTKPELRQSHSKPLPVKKSDCRIFPQGDKGVRVFFYEQGDGSVRVCELSDHRDGSYEKLINQRKVFRREYPDDAFVEWSPLFKSVPTDQAAD